jgi:hypothetical protein
VKEKGPAPAAARDLYVSPLFRGRRAYVERTCSRWFILSALHGVLDPADTIAPYDVTLSNVGVAGRRAWAVEVLASLERRLGPVAGIEFELHAGASYREFGLVDGLRARGGAVVNPTAGLSMGRQLHLYRNANSGVG